MNREWLGASVQKLEIVEQLRRTHSIKAGLGDFRIDDGQCSISFKGPGYSADVFVDRGSGQYELTETRNGWGAVINDLHKGRDTGKTWSAMIDLSAILMTLVSISGMALIFFLPKRRVSGLAALAVGAGASEREQAIIATDAKPRIEITEQRRIAPRYPCFGSGAQAEAFPRGRLERLQITEQRRDELRDGGVDVYCTLHRGVGRIGVHGVK